MTKSDAVLHDLDLLNAYPDCCIGFSITTDNDDQRRKWEPYSNSIPERMEAVKKLKEAGVKTWVSIEPILPESSPEKILIELKDDVDWWVLGQLNYYPIDRVWYREKGKLIVDLAKKEQLNIYVKKDFRKTIFQTSLKIAPLRKSIIGFYRGTKT